MSTPPNKRDQRRQERLAQLTQAQSTRRTESDEAEGALDLPVGVEPNAPEIVIAAPVTTPTIESTTAATTPTGTTKTPTRPTTNVTTPSTRTPTRPTTGAVRIASTTKTPTRPTGTGPTKTPTRPTTAPTGAGTTKTPTRPTTGPLPKTAAAAAGTRPTTRPLATAAGARKGGAAVAEPAAAAASAFVTKRDQRRLTRQNDLANVQLARRRNIQLKKRQAFIGSIIRNGFFVLIALLFAFWLIRFITAPTKPVPFSLSTSQPANGVYGSAIKCESGEQSNQHIHANLQIIVNGKSEPVPADLGIQAQCINWLHTHDTSGTIHIESSEANGKYLLGDFIAIWAQTPSKTIAAGTPVLSPSSFFGQPIDAQHPLTTYVDGHKFSGDPRTLVLTSGENIWLEYGTQQVTPKSFDFSGNSVSP